MRNTEQKSRQFCCYENGQALDWGQFCSLFKLAPEVLESHYNAQLVINDEQAQNNHLILEQGKLKLVVNNEIIEVDLIASLKQKRDILQREGTNKQLLFKALKLKIGESQLIWDTTAGLGEDSCWFLAMGAQVIASERNPLLYALIYSQIENLREEGESIQILWGSAPELSQRVQSSSEPVHAIYYDPFYQKKRKAKAKKSMELIGGAFHDHDLDAEMIAQQLFHDCKSRLVIKRADKAPCLIKSMKPTYEIKGKTIRFDIYYRG